MFFVFWGFFVWKWVLDKRLTCLTCEPVSILSVPELNMEVTSTSFGYLTSVEAEAWKKFAMLREEFYTISYPVPISINSNAYSEAYMTRIAVKISNYDIYGHR